MADPTPPALTLLATIKAEIPDLVGTTKDDELKRLIKEVTAFAENFCNRRFLYGEYTEKFDGYGCSLSSCGSCRGGIYGAGTPGRRSELTILVKGFPIESVTTLKIDDIEIDDEDYKVNLELGEIYYEEGFTEGYQNIEVKYKCGYDINTVGKEPPADLEGAVISEVIARFTQKSTQPQPSGEGFVDRRTNFLTASAFKYFEGERNINV